MLIPRRHRSRNLQAVTVEKHEYVSIGARINPQCSAERMRFAVEKRLHRTIHEHLFQLLNAANATELRKVHGLLIADATH